MGADYSTTIVVKAYGFTKKDCIMSLQACLEYNYNMDLYYKEEKNDKQYYVLTANGRAHVKFVCKNNNGPIKAYVVW
jgi:hypothetical protein